MLLKGAHRDETLLPFGFGCRPPTRYGLSASSRGMSTPWMTSAFARYCTFRNRGPATIVKRCAAEKIAKT